MSELLLATLITSVTIFPDLNYILFGFQNRIPWPAVFMFQKRKKKTKQFFLAILFGFQNRIPWPAVFIFQKRKKKSSIDLTAFGPLQITLSSMIDNLL